MAAVAIECYERRVDVMFLPACSPSFVRQCVDPGFRGEQGLSCQPGRFALVKRSVD